MALSNPLISQNPDIPVTPQTHPIIPPLPNFPFVNADLGLTTYSLQFLQQLYAAVAGVSSGDTINDVFDRFFGGEQGSVIFRGDTSWEALGPGTPNYVLTTHGPNVDPTWTAPGAGTPGSGTITGVVAGTGLAGGGFFGTVTLTLQVPVTIAHGGTGANTPASALNNLGGAPLFSPFFTGDPRAPTPPLGDNDNSIATTAFVKSIFSSVSARIVTSDTPPPSPVDGDAWWDSKAGQLYIFYDDSSSAQWAPATNQPGTPGIPGPAGPPGPPGRFSVGPSPPPSPLVGDGWWDSDTGQLYIFYDDGSSAQWVAASNQPGPPGGGGGGARAVTDDVPPTPTVDGDLWWDSASAQLYIWYDDGTSQQWVIANSIITSETALVNTVRELTARLEAAEQQLRGI